MSHRRKFFIVCFGMAASSFCSAADLYRLDVGVERNGIRIIDASADIKADEVSDLRVSGAPIPSARITARWTSHKTDEQITAFLQFSEKRGDDWVLVSEPTIVTSLGKTSSVEFSTSPTPLLRPNHYVMSVKITEISPTPGD